MSNEWRASFLAVAAGTVVGASVAMHVGRPCKYSVNIILRIVIFIVVITISILIMIMRISVTLSVAIIIIMIVTSMSIILHNCYTGNRECIGSRRAGGGWAQRAALWYSRGTLGEH